MKPSPVQFTMPIPPDNAAYLEALNYAGSIRHSRIGCLAYLNQSLAENKITVHDARTIWRGLYSVWETPFD